MLFYLAYLNVLEVHAVTVFSFIIGSFQMNVQNLEFVSQGFLYSNNLTTFLGQTLSNISFVFWAMENGKEKVHAF